MPATFSLDIIDVQEPCTAPWDQMRGDAVSRHCDHCKKQVYNLSEMSREQAEGLLSELGGVACVRFYRRADGTVSTVDCENAFARLARKAALRTRRWVCAMASIIGAAVTLGPLPRRADANVRPPVNSGQTTPPVTEPKPQPVQVVMGVMVCRPPTTQPAQNPPATQPAEPKK